MCRQAVIFKDLGFLMVSWASPGVLCWISVTLLFLFRSLSCFFFKSACHFLKYCVLSLLLHSCKAYLYSTPVWPLYALRMLLSWGSNSSTSFGTSRTVACFCVAYCESRICFITELLFPSRSSTSMAGGRVTTEKFVFPLRGPSAVSLVGGTFIPTS